jgi:hypothetical protein
MTRVRLAVVLAVVAVLAVLATAAVAVATYLGDDPPPVAEPLVVTDSASGASFEVPREDWEVRGPRSRIYYADDSGRPTVTVTGAAVFRDGYCAEQPGDSNRGFAGFTDQTFESWRTSLGVGSASERREPVELVDGTDATLRWVRLPGGTGPCAADGMELAMVTSGALRLVLVADAGEADTLGHSEIVAILSSLRARAS